MKAIVLDPEAPFTQIPRSDTLFGAICWGIRRARDEEALETLLEAFADGDPPFLISSAMPTLGVSGSEPLYLLPTPKLPGPRPADGALSEARVEALNVWKRLEYLPAPVFRRLATGEWSKRDVLDSLTDGYTVAVDGTEYVRVDELLLPATPAGDWADRSEARHDRHRPGPEDDTPPRPYVPETRLRNAVNRLTGATEGRLFHQERLHFRPDVGLSVFVRGDVTTVAEGLAAIQDRGIGGGRSVGNGQYELVGVLDERFPSPDTEQVCTLSLCIPRPEELEAFLTDGFYELDPRKGVVENELADLPSIWKRRVLALAEGSVLPRQESPYAHNPIVADGFSNGIQQYGYAFPVGMDA